MAPDSPELDQTIAMLDRRNALIKDKTLAELVKSRFEQIEQPTPPEISEKEAKFLKSELELTIAKLTRKAVQTGINMKANPEAKISVHLKDMELDELLFQYWDMQRYKAVGQPVNEELMQALHDEITRISQQEGLEKIKSR